MMKDVSTVGTPFNQYWLKKKEKCLRNFKAVRSTEEVSEHCLPKAGLGPAVLYFFIIIRCLYSKSHSTW